MQPTSVAVLKTFLLSFLAIFSVKFMNIGMLPSGSTMMKRTSTALARFIALSAMTSDITFSRFIVWKRKDKSLRNIGKNSARLKFCLLEKSHSAGRVLQLREFLFSRSFMRHCSFQGGRNSSRSTN